MNEASAVALATRNNPEGVNFVGVVHAYDAEEATRILPGFGLGELRNIADEDGSVWEHFGVVSHPAMVFINPDGTFERHQGQLGPWDLQDRIDEFRIQ